MGDKIATIRIHCGCGHNFYISTIGQPTVCTCCCEVWLVNVERAFGQTADKMQEEEERRQALWDAGYYEKD